ncbi:MAG: HPP family protein, partial [Candidatus Hydrothermarchaeaceae archaeon]
MIIMRRIERLRAEDVMVKDVVTVKGDTSIKELNQLFDKYGFNGFPVVEGDRYLGMVCDMDLLKVCVPSMRREEYPVVSDFWKLFAERIDEIMKRTVATASPDEALESVASKMMDKRIKSIAVV